jgi:hypothetical protein
MAKCRECEWPAFAVNTTNLIDGIGGRAYHYRCLNDPEHEFWVPLPKPDPSAPLKRVRPLQWRKVPTDV